MSVTHISSRRLAKNRKALGTYESGASTVQLRPNNGQGPFTHGFRQFVPRKVQAELYEFIREAIPIIDTAIWRLVSLDGSIIVEGEKAALVDEIKDWLDNVQVNDMQSGIHAFHQNFSNEAFEQGFSLSEFIPNPRRNDIIGLRVADSKFIKFKRKTSGLEILQKSDDDIDWRPLKPGTLMYWSINNENQNPYGTPMFRSCEFVAQILATMHNSLLNVWERFGDPSFSLIYKTSRRDGTNHKERCDTLSQNLNSVVRAKRQGHSADFVHAIDKDSDISLSVIGADGQVLELEAPARHVLEQIVAKTGLPPWMLGMHWSTTERLAEFEAEMVLADIVTRQSAKLPALTRLVKTLLTMRGRTWKKGDWELKFQQVNLHDVEKQARARFLNAQADMMQPGETPPTAQGKTVTHNIKTAGSKIHRCKEIYRTDHWPELDAIEDQFENKLKRNWRELADTIITTLGLKERSKGVGPDGKFTLNDVERGLILSALSQFIAKYIPGSDGNDIDTPYAAAYSQGLLQAVRLIDEDRPILDIIKNREIYQELVDNGFDLVKNRATSNIQDRILREMEAYSIAGSSPLDAAAHLEKLFDQANADWERLARSEMSLAAERAKVDEWGARNIQMLEFTPAPDACEICVALAGDYPINSAPIPVQDTHPRCRCALRPAASEA